MRRTNKFRGFFAAMISSLIFIGITNSLPNAFTSAYAVSPHFGSAGDWACGSNAKNTFSNIVNHGTTTALTLGDMSFQNTGKCWFDIVKPLDGDANPNAGGKRVKITIGNHDAVSTTSLNSYKKHFNLDKFYYSFDRDSVHVLVLNSEDPERSNKNSAQYKFVQSDLQAAHNNPNIKWIIVEFHKPFFSSPNGCDSSACKGSKPFTETYQPLFDQNKVDLVLYAHVHNYERTYPVVFNSGNPLKPTKTTNERCDYTNPKGTIYAIVGTGGNGLHTLISGKKADFMAIQQASRFGQLDLTFSSNGNKLTGQFFANEPGVAGKCADSSKILDHFTITKGTGGNSISSIPATALDKKEGQPNISFVPTLNPFT